MKCSTCDQAFETRSALANHVRWKHKRSKSQLNCRFCGKLFEAPNIGQHETACSQRNCCENCGELTRNARFCSKSCAATVNNRQGKTGYAVYRKNNGIVKQRTYRDICFEHWEKECAICGWKISIDVHHINDDNSDHRPENLIPLCQNHHMLTRLKEHRDQIHVKLIELIEQKFGASA